MRLEVIAFDVLYFRVFHGDIHALLSLQGGLLRIAAMQLDILWPILLGFSRPS
jgi:hypothetical protein